MVRRKGTTPILEDDQVLDLLESVDTSTLRGARDFALLSVLVYSWARVSAALNLAVEDYYPEGKTWRLRLAEKGDQDHVVTLHRKAVSALDTWIERAAIGQERSRRVRSTSGETVEQRAYLFRAITRSGELLEKPMHRNDALRMVKHRCKRAGVSWEKVCCYSFRATGITNYMRNGGRIDAAKEWAGHADERTTGLYYRDADRVTVEEVERMRFERT